VIEGAPARSRDYAALLLISETALLLISEAALLLISEAALLLISWKPHCFFLFATFFSRTYLHLLLGGRTFHL
jgi:hypothetical protein